MDYTIQISAFKDMDLSNYVNFKTNIIKMLELINLTYLPYVSILQSSGIDISNLCESIQSIPLSRYIKVDIS